MPSPTTPPNTLEIPSPSVNENTAAETASSALTSSSPDSSASSTAVTSPTSPSPVTWWNRLGNITAATCIVALSIGALLAVFQDRLVYMYPQYDTTGVAEIMYWTHIAHPFRQMALDILHHKTPLSPPDPSIRTVRSPGIPRLIPIVYTEPTDITQLPPGSSPTYHDLLKTHPQGTFQTQESSSPSSWYNYHDLYTNELKYSVVDMDLFWANRLHNRPKSEWYSVAWRRGNVSPAAKHALQTYGTFYPTSSDQNESGTTGHQMTLFIALPESGTFPERIIVVAGGNAMTALDWLSYIQQFNHPDQKMGGIPISNSTAYVLLDLPGFGLNQGKPNPAMLPGHISMSLHVAQAWFAQTYSKTSQQHRPTAAAAASSRAAVPIPTYFVGFSMGCTTSLIGMASLQTFLLSQMHFRQHDQDQEVSLPIYFNPAGTILHGPYSSIVDTASHLFNIPSWLLSPFISHNYDNIAIIKQVYDMHYEMLSLQQQSTQDNQIDSPKQSSFTQQSTIAFPLRIVQSTDDDICVYPNAQKLYLAYINHDRYIRSLLPPNNHISQHNQIISSTDESATGSVHPISSVMSHQTHHNNITLSRSLRWDDFPFPQSANSSDANPSDDTMCPIDVRSSVFSGLYGKTRPIPVITYAYLPSCDENDQSAVSNQTSTPLTSVFYQISHATHVQMFMPQYIAPAQHALDNLLENSVGILDLPL